MADGMVLEPFFGVVVLDIVVGEIAESVVFVPEGCAPVGIGCSDVE